MSPVEKASSGKRTSAVKKIAPAEKTTARTARILEAPAIIARPGVKSRATKPAKKASPRRTKTVAALLPKPLEVTPNGAVTSGVLDEPPLTVGASDIGATAASDRASEPVVADPVLAAPVAASVVVVAPAAEFAATALPRATAQPAKASDPHPAIWDRIEENTNLVALAHDLIQSGETFALTEDQARAVTELDERLAAGGLEFLLKAPTGSGKTEVMFRTAVNEALRSGGYVCLVAPTRDLVRQDCTYFRDRLEGTGLGVGEAHGGISPGERRTMLEGIARGETRFIIGSAMMISVPPLWDVLDRSALTIIDDVNAFDEREHLRLLEDLDCPLLFASATPNELQRFLERVGAFKNTISMRGMPFDVLPTKIHKTVGVWGEPATEQLARADALIRDHLERKSRIFVIARTRGDVPKLAQRLEATYGIPVQQLRGDMADSAEHKKRNRRSGVSVYGTSTRVEEMRAFREGAPAILAATNLVGSGLDIPAADLIVITDSDAFGESEVEQLIGRVGRRERPSDAVLLVETTFEKNPSRAMGASGRAQTFMPSGMRSNSLRFRRR